MKPLYTEMVASATLVGLNLGISNDG